MPLSLASLPTLHDHGFFPPKKVNDDTHTLVSALWDANAFGLKVKISCNTCKYLENFTLTLDSDSGKWSGDNKFQQKRNHSRDCNLLLKQKHLPICKLLCGRNPTAVDYSDVNRRVRSFKSASWKNNPTSKDKDIDKLAENGLAYRGEADHVMCIACHASLKDWKLLDYRSAHAERSIQPCTFLATSQAPETWQAARHFLESGQLDKFILCIRQERNRDIKHIELTKLAKQAIESGKIQFLDPILASSEFKFDTVTVGNQQTGIVIFAITCMQAGALKRLLMSANVLTGSQSNRYQMTDDGERWPRLCIAIECNRVDMVRLLMEHGDDPAESDLYTNPPEPRQHGTIRFALANSGRQSQGKRKLTHWTSWEYSLYSGKTNAFQMMVNNGLKINAVSDAGEQPIHIAAKTNNVTAIELLNKKGANINATTQPTEKDQTNAGPSHRVLSTHLTPLHYAARFNASIARELLIKYGADPALPSSQGKTADYYLTDYRIPAHLRRIFAPDEKDPDYFHDKKAQALMARQNKFTR